MSADWNECKSVEKNDNSERKLEQKGEDEKVDPKAIFSRTKEFFQRFSKEHREPELSEAEKKKKEELEFLNDVKDLNENTTLNPKIDIYDVPDDELLTDEEIEQLYENDPGDINGEVVGYDNDESVKQYSETGQHKYAINWGEYAKKEGIEYVTMEPGTHLSRWGNEKGSFLSDIGVDYDKLQLPTIKEKNEHSSYKVLKPFPMEKSKIEVQPWNKEESKSEQLDTAIQYRTPVSISTLIKEGYLEKVDLDKKEKN